MLAHQSTSPIVWADLFLNGLICTACEVSLLRRCWKVRRTSLTRSSQVLNPAPCGTGHEAKDMGGRTAGISAHHYFHCQYIFGKLSGRHFYWLTYREQTIALGVGSRHESVNDSVRRP